MRPTHQEQAPPAPRPLEAGGAAEGGAPGSDAAAARARPPARAPAVSARSSASPAARNRDRRPPRWGLTWQWVVAAAVTVLLAWLTYSRSGWIPILSAFDLGVHEFGHLLTRLGAAAALLVRGLVLAGGGAAPPGGLLLVAPRPVRRDPHGRLVGGEPAQRLGVHRRRAGDGPAALRRRRVGRRARLAQHPAAAQRARRRPTSWRSWSRPARSSCSCWRWGSPRWASRARGGLAVRGARRRRRTVVDRRQGLPGHGSSRILAPSRTATR